MWTKIAVMAIELLAIHIANSDMERGGGLVMALWKIIALVRAATDF
jgi:hypothetical protein